MRIQKFAEGEYYHILARGVNKQQIFFDQRDYVRFLLYILFFQSSRTVYNIGDRVTDFLKNSNFGLTPQVIAEILSKRYVALIAFSLMPNHFHLILKEVKKGGISRMMQRSLDGFTRYTHTKYKKSGHVFEGPFRAVHIKDNTQVLYLSTYIHKNPKELNAWRSKWERYPWSSYQDFIGKNRWGKFLKPSLILSQFSSPNEYARFVKQSIAKEALDKIDYPESML